jgi:hypothetical protein
MAVADLDGKNGPDVVLADYGSKRVGVLLGNGDGTLQPMLVQPLEDPAFHVAVGELNGDGVPDLAVSHFTQGGVSVLLGNGDGTFQAPATVLSGPGGWDVALGLVDGDTALDLVVTIIPDRVVVLRGKGDGTFEPPGAPSLLAGDGAEGIAIGDVSGDGKADVLVAVFRDAPSVGKGHLAVLLGNGDGTLQPEIPILVDQEPIEVLLADANGDGKADAVVRNFSGILHVLLGTGDAAGGLFQSPIRAGGGSPAGFALGDMDDDGKLDGIGSASWNQVGVLFGDGTGYFGRAVMYESGSGPHGIAAADFDGDGLLDIASADTNTGDVSILLGAKVCKGP